MNQAFILACKICGSVARKASKPESLQDLLICEDTAWTKGPVEVRDSCLCSVLQAAETDASIAFLAALIHQNPILHVN